MTSGEGPDRRLLVEQLGRQRLSRREFVARASALGLSTATIGSLLAACGADDDNASLPNEGELPAVETLPGAATDRSGRADEIAVQAAQPFSGISLNVTWESGVRATDPKLVWGPDWEELTGITIDVIELDHADLLKQAIAAHEGRSGAFDILSIEPAWVPELVGPGVIVPIDDLASEYLSSADLDDYHPLYRALATWAGRRYGFVDDGSVLILYYRRDVFDDLGLSVPTTWDGFQETAAAITEALAPDVYGADFWRNPGLQHWPFLQQFRAQGGEPFDATMAARVNSEIGVMTLTQMLAQNEIAAPDVLEHGPIAVLNAWLGGSVGMMFWWPQSGRWSAGFGGAGQEGFEFVSESNVVERVGYAVMPGGHGQHAGGFQLALGGDSRHPEAAYLAMQWATSPAVSLRRLKETTALHSPYRRSHFSSEEFRELWPSANAYLDTLSAAADVALTDFIIPGWQDYALALDQAVTAAYEGEDPQAALDLTAAEWNAITERLGLARQQSAWESYLELPGSTTANTIAGAAAATEDEP